MKSFSIQATLQKIVGTTAFALLTLANTGIAQAQSFPAKPIRLIAPFAPGGSTDINRAHRFTY